MNRFTETEIRPEVDQTGRDTIMSTAVIARENVRFAGSGGVSQEGRRYAFVPAFLDSGTGEVYLSRFADGRLAPIHLLDGLPERLVVARTARRVTAVKGSVIAGFVRDRRFYTREQAALAASRENENSRRH